MTKYSRYNTDYYHAEIKKMLHCSNKATGFAVYKCLSCGVVKDIIEFTSAAEVKHAPSVGSGTPERV